MRYQSCSARVAEDREYALAQKILKTWREEGSSDAHKALVSALGSDPSLNSKAPLLEELSLRLSGSPGPRILVDGLWFCRPYGGVSRVWEMILSCWSLPNLTSIASPIALIDRNSHLALSSRFESLEGKTVDPLNPEDVGALAVENSSLCKSWGANVFLSSWISTTCRRKTWTPELALVHDCMPERSQPDQALLTQRRRWLQGAKAHLAVSAATAQDVEGLLKLPKKHIPWCHPGVENRFNIRMEDPQVQRLWQQLKRRLGLNSSYVLLPATSRVGSYKNPELVAHALSDPRLQDTKLVLSGIAAEERCQELINLEPTLTNRCIGASFTDLELAFAYRQALAVVIPSRIEGFGLPAIEAITSDAYVIVADSRGLREAGAEAALRCDCNDPRSLTELLLLLKEDDRSRWVRRKLDQRRQQRLSRLNIDALGIALLHATRQIYRSGQK